MVRLPVSKGIFNVKDPNGKIVPSSVSLLHGYSALVGVPPVLIDTSAMNLLTPVYLVFPVTETPLGNIFLP
jgi:hypothetical protein